jgi:formate hydrogenlyase subunit 3/multisubunit Na+/H+ antiporter MnhD subunit
MSLLLVMVVAFAAAAAVLGARTHRLTASAIGSVGWLAVLLATLAVGPGDGVTIGEGALVATPYGRLMILSAAGSGLLLGLVVIAAGVTPVVHAAGLAAVGALVVAATGTDPVSATWASTGGAAAVLVVGLVAGRGGAGAVELGAGLRATAAAGAAGAVAIAVLAASTTDGLPDPAIGSLAFVAAGASLAIRAAAVPFHRWGARLADVAPRPLLAPLLGWLAAVGVVVILAWADVAVAPIADDLGPARAAVVAVALITLTLGGLASWLADDLAHTVAYAAISAAGLGLLGVAAADPAAWSATRSVVLVGAVTMTGLTAWVVALEGAYRTRRLADLTGWARRSPLLAVTLVVSAWVAVGLPLLATFEARLTIVDAALEGPLAWPARILLVAPVLGLARALVVGLKQPDPAVIAGAGERPVRPRRPEPADAPPSRSRRAAEELAIAWSSVSLNAALVASVAALAIAILGLGLAAGGLGLPAAAEGPAPGMALPLDPGEAPTPIDIEPSG